MGDTTGATTSDRVCGQRGAAMEIPGADPVYRCGRANDFFLDYAVPQTALWLGYAKTGRATADLFIYPDLPFGRPLARTRTGARGAGTSPECVL